MSRKDIPHTIQEAMEIAYALRPWKDADYQEWMSWREDTDDSIDSLENGKQDKLVFDANPTPGSQNPVTSGGVYDAILSFDSASLKSVALTNQQKNELLSGSVSITLPYEGDFPNDFRTIELKDGNSPIYILKNSYGSNVYYAYPVVNSDSQSGLPYVEFCKATYSGGVLSVSLTKLYAPDEIPTEQGSFVLSYESGSNPHYEWKDLESEFDQTIESAKQYLKDYVDGKVSTAYKFQGSVENYSDLPSNPSIGDLYNVETADPDHGIDAGEQVVWTGTSWDDLGGVFDTSAIESEISSQRSELVSMIESRDSEWLLDSTTSAINHVFKDNSETTYTQIPSSVTLTIPSTVRHGFISSVVIENSVAGMTFDIVNQSIYNDIHIVRYQERLSSFRTSYGGKVTVFCNCDGASVELYIAEERDAR